ncbi:MAG: cation:proton antiporter [Alphaproteobacteria bacterium]|nr:cation:proton antiporter [Alphaproteobacteria bacterium]
MSGGAEFGQLLASLTIIYAAAKVGGELALRLRQPAVLGELAAGLLVGVSGLQWLHPDQQALHLMAQIGVTLLLFEIGLESDMRALLKVGWQALLVGLIGMLAPFGLGLAVMLASGSGMMAAIFVGAALTATSIGITINVLQQMGCLKTKAGQTILGAAILDDILGVVVLSVVVALSDGQAITPASVGMIIGKALAFLLVALVVGKLAAPYFGRLIRVLKSRGVLLSVALIFAFGLAYAAEMTGSAALIGAFAAGLVLAETDQRHPLEHQIKPVTDFFLPIFFILVGAQVQLGTLWQDKAMMTMVGLLTVAAVVGKLMAGLGARGTLRHKLVVGSGMVPRGELGLIFASMGLASAVLNAQTHAALVVVVLVTTFLGPVLLNGLVNRR